MMMTGKVFAHNRWLPGVRGLALVVGLLLSGNVLAEKVEYAFPDDPGVTKEPGMMQILSNIRSDMGWDDSIINRKDGSTLIVVTGIGTVSAPRKSPAFVGSRQNAFDKAMLQAKKAFVELQEVNISGELESFYAEPSVARQEKENERKRREGLAIEAAGRTAQARAEEIKQQSDSEAVATAADEGMKLVREEVEKRLRDLGYDPSKPVDQQTLEKVTQKESFKKLIRSTAKARVVGLQPFKVIENYTDGGQGEVGVIAVWSPKLSATAKAIYSGDLSSIPNSDRSKPAFKEQVPSDTRVLLSTFGVRQVIGPNGEYGVLGFAQAAPRAGNRRAINAAYNKAKLSAMFNVRQFAGEIASVETQQRNSETATSFSDGMESYEYDDSYQEKIRAKAEAINISGMRVVKYWNGEHPITGAPVAGAVVLWTPSGAQTANSVKNEMKKSSSPAASTGGTRTEENPYEGEYRGASEAADMDAF